MSINQSCTSPAYRAPTVWAQRIRPHQSASIPPRERAFIILGTDDDSHSQRKYKPWLYSEDFDAANATVLAYVCCQVRSITLLDAGAGAVGSTFAFLLAAAVSTIAPTACNEH